MNKTCLLKLQNNLSYNFRQKLQDLIIILFWVMEFLFTCDINAAKSRLR
jgi:hypothetical protein